MKVGVINYGMGNLGSVCRALGELRVQPVVLDHPEALWDVERIILPGVGGFSEAANRLHSAGWTPEIRRQILEQHKPLLGICLGMQLLASEGDEGALTPGLALIPGQVKRMDTLGCRERIPHVGWNEITCPNPSPLFARIPAGTDFYFVHSYVFSPMETQHVIATVNYGVPLTAAVQHRNVYGTQFHPEKSSKAGRALLQNFLAAPPC